MLSGYLAALLLCVAPADTEAVWDDYSKQSVNPHHIAYVSLSSAPDLEAAEAVLRVIVCSLSSKTNLRGQLPVRVPNSTAYRLDLQSLGWESVWQQEVLENYPYRKDITLLGKYPLVIDGLWFITNVTDPIKTGDMQYQLLYQGKPPKNLKEFQDYWKVNTKDLAWGFIEGDSGVAVNKKRTMASFPTANRGGSAWGTFDFRKLDIKTDPLENLKPFTHGFDAQEWIVMQIKTDGRKSGVVPVWWLNDNKGARQEKAPADIVRDSTELRGVEIRNTISCYACHTQGLIAPTLDEYDKFFRAGARAYAYNKETQDEIEAFYEADLVGDIKASQKLYADGIDMICGLTPEQFSTAYINLVKSYDEPVTLGLAALEVGCDDETLKLAFGWVSANNVNISPRLAQLASGVPCARERWEELQQLALQYVLDFEKGLKK